MMEQLLTSSALHVQLQQVDLMGITIKSMAEIEKEVSLTATGHLIIQVYVKCTEFLFTFFIVHDITYHLDHKH